MSEPQPDLDIHLRLERRARLGWALRIKQVISVITTAAYAALAGGLWKPLFDHTRFSATNALLVGLAVFALGLSVYIAPEGEFDAKR